MTLNIPKEIELVLKNLDTSNSKSVWKAIRSLIDIIYSLDDNFFNAEDYFEEKK